MNTAMKPLDTLKIYERLKIAENFDAQAKELAEILRELTDDQIAQKNDLKNTEMNLQKDLKNTEMILQNDLKTTEINLQNDLKNTEMNLQKDLKNMEMNLQNDLKNSEMILKNELRVEIEKSKNSTIKWVIGWVTGLIIAQTGFMLTHLTLLK